MSMEHIFRDPNDIRVFDLFSEMGFNKDEAIDIHDVIKLLECGEIERIQIEDSVDHLVREQVLTIELVDEKWTNGCRICSLTDKAGFLRLPGHKSHIPEETGTSKIEHYYLSDNNLAKCLTAAVMESSWLEAEKIMKEEDITKDRCYGCGYKFKPNDERIKIESNEKTMEHAAICIQCYRKHGSKQWKEVNGKIEYVGD